MRTISKRTKYGLRAVLALGRRYGKEPVLIGTLAREEAIPLKFLQSILLDLKSRGIVDSKPGPGGGCKLSKPPEQVSMGTVIRMLEGPLAPLPCASETAYRRCDDCVNVEQCGTRIVMREVRDAMAAILDKTTLAAVIARVDEMKDRQADEAPMYYI